LFLNVWILSKLKKSSFLLIFLQIFFLQSCSTPPVKEEPLEKKPVEKTVQKVEVKKEPPPPTLEDLSIVKADDGRPYQISKICGELPVFVEVSASWCEACRELYPTTEKLRKMFEGKVCFLRIMIDEKPFEGDTEVQVVYPVSSPEVLNFGRTEALPRVVVLNKDEKEPRADLTGKYPFLYYYGILSEL